MLRPDKPDNITYHKTGNISQKQWGWPNEKKYKDFILHRVGQPAQLTYFEHHRNIICGKCWFIEGRYHREDGPAYTSYYEDGNRHYEEWMIDGLWHNTMGPANIIYDENGTITEMRWFVHDIQYDLSDWLTLSDLTECEKVEMKLIHG